MSEQTERNELARFCARLGRLRPLLRGPAAATARAQVEQIVRAARRGEPVTELIEALDLRGARKDTVAPPRGPGIGGETPTAVSYVELPPVTGSYVCPVDACDRIESRRAGSPMPLCDVHEQALRFLVDGGPTG